MLKRSRIPISSLLLPLTVAFILVAAICSALYLREANGIAFTNLDNENRRMDRFSGLFKSDIAAAVSDLRLLSTGDGLHTWLNTGLPADFERAELRAVFFSKDNPDYDKLRFIDESGMEVIRINANGTIVPPNELQDKSSREFFQKAHVLAANQVYISAVDLNIEHGAIELPIKPTLRLAMPVFDDSGKRRGIYVINMLAEHSIHRLINFVPKYSQRFRMLNAQGYWLGGVPDGQQWGFELPDRAGFSLAKTDPELWAQIQNNPTGQVPYKGGWFTWARTVPGESAQGKPVELKAEEDYLIVASQISSDEWASIFASLRQTFVVVALILLTLATVITWFFQARRRIQLERDKFFTITRDMLCVAGFDGYFKRVNPAWETALGFTAAELMAKPFLEFVHPDDRERTIAETVTLGQGGEVISFENRYRCKDGSYKWLLWSARSMVEEELIYGSARDLTERKEIEESLRHSEEWNRSIISSAHDAFVSIDANGRIKDWNKQAESTFGWQRAEAIGRYLHETIIPPQYRDAHIRGMSHFKATGEGPVLEQDARALRAAPRWQGIPGRVCHLAVEDGRGNLVPRLHPRHHGAQGCRRARIQKLNDELKQRADLLEVANKELESFSYSVSHDLRAPLRHIHGFVELLQKAPAFETDETSKRHMGVIARAAKEMGRLIDDLLAFSRTGRAEMRPVTVDMNEMVEQIIHEGSIDMKDRKIVWKVEPLPKVQGDPGLLRLVWINLLENAVKYTKQRAEATIEVGQMVRNSAESGAPEQVFYVRDNGVGFDMQYAGKLFGVFQRLHRAEDFEGTGIGLANVQRIIHRHGGRVWAEAMLDSGRDFFLFPTTEPTLNRGAQWVESSPWLNSNESCWRKITRMTWS